MTHIIGLLVGLGLVLSARYAYGCFRRWRQYRQFRRVLAECREAMRQDYLRMEIDVTRAGIALRRELIDTYPEHECAEEWRQGCVSLAHELEQLEARL